MAANIAIGVQDFSTLIENHYFYIDRKLLSQSKQHLA